MRKKNAGSTPAGSAPVSFGTSVASSMITMLLQSAYSVVDGLFVSNLVGDTALAAVNVAWPIIAVITAAGTGIGAGGASYMSIKQGEQKWEESNRVRANTILALFAAGAVITVCFLLFLTPLLKLMGTSGNLLTAAEQYGRIMIAGGVIQVSQTAPVRDSVFRFLPARSSVPCTGNSSSSRKTAGSAFFPSESLLSGYH